MSKLTIVAPIASVLVIGSVSAAYVGATRLGLSVTPAAPDTLIPAGATAYVGLDRGGDQGATLSSLWAAYQAHPGTSAALAHLSRDIARSGLNLAQVSGTLDTLGDRVAVAAWAPSPTKPTGAGVLVAQVKATDALAGKNPLRGLATSSAAWTYGGTQVYRIVFTSDTSATPAYGALLLGNGVVATDAATIKQVIDLAHAGSAGRTLAKDPTYTATMSQLPATRLLSVYYTPALFTGLAAYGRSQATHFGALNGLGAVLPRQHGALAQLAQATPVGVSVTASTAGLDLRTTAHTAPVAVSTTPNQAASVLGDNALLYTSGANLGGLVKGLYKTYTQALGSQASLAQIEAQARIQTGIDLERDVFPLLSGEFSLDLNDTGVPMLAAYAAQQPQTARAGAMPGGSLQLALYQTDPAAAQAAIIRIVAALNRQSTFGAPMTFVPSHLADGSTAYTVVGMTDIGYRLKGHWLMMSPALSADVAAATHPLAADASYKAAVAGLSDTGTLSTVSYWNIARTLGLVDKWIAYEQQVDPSMTSSVTHASGWTWPQVEALIAPVRTLASVSHRTSTATTSHTSIAIGH